MTQIRLKVNWSRAKTDSSDIIIGWDDYHVGDVVEIEEKDIPTSFSLGAYEIIKIQEETQNPKEKIKQKRIKNKSKTWRAHANRPE